MASKEEREQNKHRRFAPEEEKNTWEKLVGLQSVCLDVNSRVTYGYMLRPLLQCPRADEVNVMWFNGYISLISIGGC